jgi:osmotically-inducible protein OsmY
MAHVLTGAVSAMLLDPARGRSRRAQLVDRGRAMLNRSGRRAERMARGVSANATALAARASAALAEPAELDDNSVTLAARVESELFRDPSIPKGALNINAENGIIVIRGELPDGEMRDRIESSVRRIPGVWEVHNLTHLPGEPAPTAR